MKTVTVMDLALKYALKSSHPDVAYISFIAGFEEAIEMALRVWEKKRHSYCDYFYEGRDRLKLLPNEPTDMEFALWRESNQI